MTLRRWNGLYGDEDTIFLRIHRLNLFTVQYEQQQQKCNMEGVYWAK